MFGLIAQIHCTPGGRDQLGAILAGMADRMPGCLSYVVSDDREDPDALWITEVWVDEDHHRASLSLPQVQEAIAAGRPFIAGVGQRFETTPRPGTVIGPGG
jgi:quinol monooxygenase YgiN